MRGLGGCYLYEKGNFIQVAFGAQLLYEIVTKGKAFHYSELQREGLSKGKGHFIIVKCNSL